MTDSEGPFLINMAAASSNEEILKVMKMISDNLEYQLANSLELVLVMTKLIKKLNDLPKSSETIQ